MHHGKVGYHKVVNAEAVRAIAAIEEPTERHAAFLVAMNEARELQAELARRRGLTCLLYTSRCV